MKNIKLTKEEFDHIDNLLFSRSNQSKKNVPLYPLVANMPFGRETPSLNSRFSSFSSAILRSSRKHLEVFDKDFESLKSSVVMNDIELPSPSMLNTKDNYDLMAQVHESVDVDEPKITISESEIPIILKSPPRKMTDAAKELIASININIGEASEIIQELPKNTMKLPVFDFKLPETKLPEFHFDIPVEKSKSLQPTDEPIQESKYLFDFDISGYKKSKNSYTCDKLPKFNFEIDFESA